MQITFNFDAALILKGGGYATGCSVRSILKTWNARPEVQKLRTQEELEDYLCETFLPLFSLIEEEGQAVLVAAPDNGDEAELHKG